MERLYLVGHPVAHSKSPAMHNAAYRALGLDWEYVLNDCATAEEARAFLAQDSWLACNVTMPYKPIAYEIASARSVAATLAQGANVLVRSAGGACVGDGGARNLLAEGANGLLAENAGGLLADNIDGTKSLLADNTDGIGCVRYLERCGVAFPGARVVVCGTGPTSRAIMHACAVAGAASVCLASRDADRANATVGRYLSALGQIAENPDSAFAFDDSNQLEATNRIADQVDLAGMSYETGETAIASADIIIDATSLGMKPGDPAPFDTQLLRHDQVVLDVVYGHGETSLLAAARDKGCAAYDGEGMLVAQAVETVRDIAQATQLFEISPSVDLFDVMARAAGFDL